jgi:hypothetical protein
MDLRTSEEFARWFAALDERTAEDVAATIEVIVELGTKKAAPGSTEWLTWYEHPSLSERSARSGPGAAWERLRHLGALTPLDPSAARFFDAWASFRSYASRVVKHLGSPELVARVERLGEQEATAFRDAVARIRKTVTRRALQLSEYQVRRRIGLRALTPREESDLSAFLDESAIRDEYLAALAAAGFAVADLPAHTPALREIALRAPPPGVRLLYGVDDASDRALVVLGERLDRSFYGDSVRRAERQWQAFLDGETRKTQPARAR